VHAGKRRCIVPVDGFFEWRAIKGQKAKQPYARLMTFAGSRCRGASIFSPACFLGSDCVQVP
jgi:hypothetical protein